MSRLRVGPRCAPSHGWKTRPRQIHVAAFMTDAPHVREGQDGPQGPGFRRTEAGTAITSKNRTRKQFPKAHSAVAGLSASLSASGPGGT